MIVSKNLRIVSIGVPIISYKRCKDIIFFSHFQKKYLKCRRND